MGVYDSFSKKKLPLRLEMQYQNGSAVEEVVKKMELSLLVILNTPYYANGLKLGKNNGTADGILDCCMIDTRSFWDTFRVALKIQRGTHTRCHKVEYAMSPSFKVFSERPLDLLADGEIIEKVKEFEVSVIKEKIQVLCN